MPDLIVSEIFGPTIQGEGPSLGTPSMFLRLGICNLRCTWCDTKYTWDFTPGHYDPKVELHRMSDKAILKELRALSDQEQLRAASDETNMLVVTGGEPLLQGKKLRPILETVRDDWGWRIELETAGTVAPSPGLGNWVNTFNVSPKLRNSGNDSERSYRPEVLELFALLAEDEKAIFKFVVENAVELDEVAIHFVERFSIPRHAVYIMPQGTTVEVLQETSQKIVAEVISRGWSLTTRLHTLIWGNERGY